MCITTINFDSIFFLGVTSFLNLEIWPKWKILLKTACQRNSSETAQQNFVKLCNCLDVHFYRKCWFDLLKEQFVSLLNFGQNYFVQLRWNWFSVRLPVTNAWNCHSQAMLERGVCELAYSFFHLLFEFRY